MSKLKLGTFTVTEDNKGITFNDLHSEVYLEFKYLSKLRSYLDRLDDSLNSKKNPDGEDNWLPEDIYHGYSDFG